MQEVVAKVRARVGDHSSQRDAVALSSEVDARLWVHWIDTRCRAFSRRTASLKKHASVSNPAVLEPRLSDPFEKRSVVGEMSKFLLQKSAALTGFAD